MPWQPLFLFAPRQAFDWGRLFSLPVAFVAGTFPAATANNCSKELRRSCFRWETTLLSCCREIGHHDYRWRSAKPIRLCARSSSTWRGNRRSRYILKHVDSESPADTPRFHHTFRQSEPAISRHNDADRSGGLASDEPAQRKSPSTKALRTR